MSELFGRELDPDSDSDSAQPLLDEYSPIVQSMAEAYPKCKDQGDRFLAAASPLLTRRGESKLAVSSPCALVAVQLGELEGRYQLMLRDWREREVSLKQTVEWHSFRSSVEQVRLSFSCSLLLPLCLFFFSFIGCFFFCVFVYFCPPMYSLNSIFI